MNNQRTNRTIITLLALLVVIVMLTGFISTVAFDENNNNAFAQPRKDNNDSGSDEDDDVDEEFPEVKDTNIIIVNNNKNNIIDNSSEHGSENNNIINKDLNKNSKANNAASEHLFDLDSVSEIQMERDGVITRLRDKWSRLDGTAKKAVVDYTVKAVQSMNNMILDMIQNDYATDYPKYIIQTLKQGSSAAATLYFESPAAGSAVEGAFDIVLSWFHVGEVSQSDLQILESRINGLFDDLKDELSEVKVQISNLSDSMNNQILNVLNKLDGSFEAYYAKTQVTDFIYSTSGNFSYNTIRDYLYSSNRYSLYSDLATALANGADEDVTKEAYDNLYYALMHYDTASGIKSNFDKYGEYFFGDANRKSISQYYYDYLSSNQSYIDGNASLLASEFASQVYFDYIALISVLRLINTYQLTEIYINNSELPKEDLMNARYYYGSGATDYVTVNSIKSLIEELDALEIAAYNQMLEDTNYILGLGESYLVEEVSGIKRYVSDNDKGTFGNLVQGETIYLNQVVDLYCLRYGLNPTMFEYEFKASEDLLQPNKKLGYYKVATTENFTGRAIYNGTVLYTINFRVGDNTKFAGGIGTEGDPYVIVTADQFKLIYKDSKHMDSYALVSNIDFNEETLNPLGTQLYPYEGTFNGYCCTIKNAKIDSASENATSIFGIIGNSGSIKNLEVENFTVSETQNNDATKVTAGIIAGINNGQIVSCFIRSSKLTVKRLSSISNDNLNKAISMFVGGIAGENNGVIIYSKVESTEINTESKRFYSANKDTDNRNNAYSGGIVGANNSGVIENCYVSDSVKVHTYGAGEMEEGLSFRYPYVTVQSGGIAGIAASLKNIMNVYSSTASVSTDVYVKNHAYTGGSFENHCNQYSDSYVPNQKDTDLKTIKGANSDVYKINAPERKVKFEFLTGGETGATIDPEFNCSTDLIYVGTDTTFKMDNMKLSLILVDGDKETVLDSCLSVVGIYGFNVINPDKEYDVQRKLTMNIYDSLNNAVYSIKLSYYVRKNSIYKIAIPENYNSHFEQNSQVPTNVNQALNIPSVSAYYHDGTIVNVIDDSTFTVDTSTLGGVKGKVTYATFELDVDCTIICSNPLDQEEVTILYYVLSEDKQTCRVIGYKTYYCSLCGKTVIENISKVYDVVIRNEAESTCALAGYTGDLCIEPEVNDDVVLTETIVEKGKYLPLKEHNYDYENVNADDYRDEHSHYCVDCHHQEAHMYRTIETSNQVVCECVVCKYKTTLEINSREEIEKLPRVVVSNAYAVQSTKEVKVFIDLHASTGITAANFSVNFDPELKLVSYKLGDVLNGNDSIDSFKVYSDHINVTLVRSGTDYATDGTILALVFKLPADPDPSTRFVVEVTNKDNKDKFTDKNGDKTDFIAYAGGIIIVSHMPGDINGDNNVSVVDAVILSNYVTLDTQDQVEFVANMTTQNPKFDIAYGDVNLDGSIDISDIVQILRYTTGGYETTFVSNVFEIALNYDDGSDTIGSFFVRYDNGNSTFGSLQSLPELQREGYKFEGWYTEFGGQGIKVTNDTPVFYNKAQYKQTLYAHFIANEIEFDANGGIGYKQTLNYLSTMDLHNTYNTYYSYFEKESVVELDGNGIGATTTLNKAHTFLGWATAPNGEVVYTEDDVIDLRASGYNGVGHLTLYAVWSVETIDAYKPTVEGYTFVAWTGPDKKTIVWTGDDDLVVNGEIALYAKWRKNIFSFVYNSVGADSHKESVSRSISQYNQPLWTNTFVRTGYSFMGWSLNENGEVDFTDEDVLNATEFSKAFEYVDNMGIVNLYAVWQGQAYTIIFNKNSEAATGSIENVETRVGEEVELPTVSDKYTPEAHKHFEGWARTPAGEVCYLDGEKVVDVTQTSGTIELFAIWAYDRYSVVYTVSGESIMTDIVSYNSPYTFRTAFTGMPGYSVERYVSEDILEGLVIENWTYETNVVVPVFLMYEGNMFTYDINEGRETVQITGYNGPTNGNLIIPYYININNKLYAVDTIKENAFASTASRQLDFDKIIISQSVNTINSRSFINTQANAVYMSNNVTNLYRNAFSSMLYVEDFVMPVAALDDVCFGTRITNLYYLGTSTQWSNSNIILGVTYDNLYYYYTGTMTFGKKYWTYRDGEIVILSL